MAQIHKKKNQIKVKHKKKKRKKKEALDETITRYSLGSSFV